MKSIIAMSLAGLIGLCATESHANESNQLRCQVKACINARTPQELCDVDKKDHALITDFGDQFAIKYGGKSTTLSPELYEQDGGDTGVQINTGKHSYIFWRSQTGKAFGLMRPDTKTAFIFTNCEVVD